MVIERVPMIVNFDLPFEEALRLGKFDDVHPYVTGDHFPRNGHRGTMQRFASLIQIIEPRTTTQVIDDLKQRRLVSAGPHETLAFAGIRPEAQRNVEIVGLEALWPYGPGGYRLHMCLNGNSEKRKLGVTYASGYTWDAGTQFLGVTT